MVALSKIGSFIKGICHPPRQDVTLMKEAGFGWGRIDVPYPYEPDSYGTPNQSFLDFCARCAWYYEQGIRAMCVSPYPRNFAAAGINPATTEGLEKVRETCRFIAHELQHLRVAWQVTNELNVFHFRHPLTLDQCPAFIAAGLQGIRDGTPNAACGYNTNGIGTSGLSIMHEAKALFGSWLPSEDTTLNDAEILIRGVMPYHDLVDYIGLDTYRGTWFDGEPEDIIKDAELAHEITGLPVLLQEFGFSSKGAILNLQDVNAYIAKLGYNSMHEIVSNPTAFMQSIPPKLAGLISKSPPAEQIKTALHLVPHILKMWPGGSRVYPHTLQGQADFYDKMLSLVLAHPHICGAFLYEWTDKEQCFMCHAMDCPCETDWGIIDRNAQPKPAYHIVKKHFA